MGAGRRDVHTRVPMNNDLPIRILPLLVLPLLAACEGSDPTAGLGAAQWDEPPAPALVQVAERGDLAALNTLLQHDPRPNVRDSCDWTPLMKAALNGHLATLDRLLAAGATVDAEDKGGYTALMLAASNNHADIVARLAEHGAMLDHQESTQGLTALIWSAKQGQAQAVEVLLAHGADATLKDFSGHTAADWARESGRTDILTLLERRG